MFNLEALDIKRSKIIKGCKEFFRPRSLSMPINYLDFSKNIHSQFGQDGIIEEVFSKLDVKNGFFVEFGAWDGKHLSNCRRLFEDGWSGAFIEGDHTRFQDLLDSYRNDENILCIHAMVETSGESTLDEILSKQKVDREVDFLSVDIDGLDLEVFESIEKYKPKLVCLEGGQGAHPYEPRVPENMTSCLGQSLKTIHDAATRKGYSILSASHDIFLLRNDLVSDFDLFPDLKTLYINGLIHQPSHIVIFYNRLKKFSRSNPIFDHVLSETSFFDFKDARTTRESKSLIVAKKWIEKNNDKIVQILEALPPTLWEPPETSSKDKIG